MSGWYELNTRLSQSILAIHNMYILIYIRNTCEPPEAAYFSLKEGRWAVSGVVVLCVVCHLDCLTAFLISYNIHVYLYVHVGDSRELLYICSEI